MPNFLAFLSYVCVANLSPGPNTILSMSNSGRLGLKKGIRFNLGVAVGAFFVLLICSFFSLTLYSVFPSVKLVMVWAGAGYILWLAWRTLTTQPLAANKQVEVKGSLFVQGLILQFVNPNTILYGLSVFTTFIIPYYNASFILIVLSALLAIAAFIGTGCWALFGSVFQKVIARHSKAINTGMAILLAYCAASLVITG